MYNINEGIHQTFQELKSIRKMCRWHKGNLRDQLFGHVMCIHMNSQPKLKFLIRKNIFRVRSITWKYGIMQHIYQGLDQFLAILILLIILLVAPFKKETKSIEFKAYKFLKDLPYSE